MAKQETPKTVYRFGDGVYLNITNRCPNLCAFCIKTKWRMDFHGNNLNLEGNEPSANDVVAALDAELKKAPFKEVVFCGYGEPTMRLDVLLFTAQTLKGWMAQAKYPPFKIRLNTNGLGNLINHKNIVPELRRVVDIVNVSLNAENAEVWRKIVRPADGYEDGYDAVREFIRLCAAAGFDRVVASCVDRTGADAEAVKKIAEADGAQFYLRSFLDAQD
ncbi:TatD family nuclease-associated radical SAM protein [Candidatus Avelusimicrobium alvi]|uniref:TatD family nuclease-associated radical SAM protein n=1 Tax=Candidatus Avelusimicrobium alvi TaxID=3416221 RepID=UPI003D14D871